MTNIDQLLHDQLRHDDGYQARQFDQWLAEDLSAAYDSLVAAREETPAAVQGEDRHLLPQETDAAEGHRHAADGRCRWLRVGVAAAALAALVGIATWLWPTARPGETAVLATGISTKAKQPEAVATPPSEPQREYAPVRQAARAARRHSPPPHTKGHGRAHGGESPAATATLAALPGQEGARQVTATTAPQHGQTAADSLDYYLARLEQSLEAVGDSIYAARAEQIIRADARLQRLVQRVYMNELELQRQEQQALYLKY